MRNILFLGLGVSVIWACGDAEDPKVLKEVDVSSANDDVNVIPRGPEGTESVSEAELELLSPFLTDLREGIREFSPGSIGICKGQGKDCTEFVGLDAGVLPDGKYMIRGDFQAPKLAPEEGWKVTFSVDCEITKKTGDSTSTTTKNYAKEYKISHVNRTEYGYRLSPLYNIESPSSRGEHKCNWSLSGNNLSEPVVWKGSYTIPAKQTYS